MVNSDCHLNSLKSHLGGTHWGGGILISLGEVGRVTPSMGNTSFRCNRSPSLSENLVLTGSIR